MPPATHLVPGARHGDERVLATAQRPGRDGRLAPVVLAPVDEDLAGPQVLGHPPHDQVGQVARERLRELLDVLRGDLGRGALDAAPAQGGVELHPLRPARDGHRDQVGVLHAVADLPRHGAALVEPGTGPGVEVDHDPVGRLRHAVDHAPLRHVQLERAALGEPHEGRERIRGLVGDQRVGDVAVGVDYVYILHLTVRLLSAEKDADGNWNANAWVKQGILLGFRMGKMVEMSKPTETFQIL